MPAIAVERTIGETKRAVFAGLIGYNEQKMGKQRYRRFAVSLRDKKKIVGGVIGEVWMTVLFIQWFWIDEKFRGKGLGVKLIRKIEDEARRFGAVRSYVDTMSVQAPGFYRACGYKAFGSLKGYPRGISRHWFTKTL
jgi:GNAT superfamily N-acetyltransferase